MRRVTSRHSRFETQSESGCKLTAAKRNSFKFRSSCLQIRFTSGPNSMTACHTIKDGTAENTQKRFETDLRRRPPHAHVVGAVRGAVARVDRVALPPLAGRVQVLAKFIRCAAMAQSDSKLMLLVSCSRNSRFCTASQSRVEHLFEIQRRTRIGRAWITPHPGVQVFHELGHLIRAT